MYSQRLDVLEGREGHVGQGLDVVVIQGPATRAHTRSEVNVNHNACQFEFKSHKKSQTASQTEYCTLEKICEIFNLFLRPTGMWRPLGLFWMLFQSVVAALKYGKTSRYNGIVRAQRGGWCAILTGDSG